MSLKKLRQQLDSREISAVELTQYYLDKITAYDKTLNSFINVCGDSAIEQAKEAQKLIDGGCQKYLTGIPAAVKDNICTKGIRTTCASGMLSEFVPAYNATAVQRLLDSSAVILGKTNLDEFAMGSSNETSYFGAVKNPHDTSRIPGGSSGGSAAAVSAGLCAAALGSDTGGSVRQPAALCGVTGFKPTYGAISRFGLVAFASSLDTIGLLTNSAEDAAHLMNCIAGSDPMDSTSHKKSCADFTEAFGKPVKGMRIGVQKEFFSCGISPEVSSSVLEAIDFFKSCGCEIIDISINHFDFAPDIYKVISSAEASSNLARYDGIKYGIPGKCRDSFEKLISSSRSVNLGEEVKKRILFGAYVLSEENYENCYKKALALREELKKDYKSAFEKCDLILSPTTPDAAGKFSDLTPENKHKLKSDKLIVSASLAGLPSISTPCGYTKNAMPIGLSVTGAAFSDSRVLAAADFFEREYFDSKKRQFI